MVFLLLVFLCGSAGFIHICIYLDQLVQLSFKATTHIKSVNKVERKMNKIYSSNYVGKIGYVPLRVILGAILSMCVAIKMGIYFD